MRNLIANALVLTTCLLSPLTAHSQDDKVQSFSIGALYNLTGGQSGLDIPSSQGAQYAIQVAQERKTPVKLDLRDGKTNPKVIQAQAQSIFRQDNQVVALMGFSDTDMVLAAAPIAAKHHRVFVTSGATSPKLPEQVPEYLYLACYGDNVQAAAAAEWAHKELQAKRVSIIFDETMSYTRLLKSYFKTRFTELGGSIASQQPYNKTNIKEAVEALKNADIVFAASGPDTAIEVVQALRKAGIKTPVIGGDGFDIEAWNKYQELEDIYFTTHVYLGPENTNPTVRSFVDGFKKANPGIEPDAFTALGFDTVNLILASVQKAGSTEPKDVREALASTRDFRGVTGTISYVNGSQIPRKPVAVIEINAGKRIWRGDQLPTSVPAP